MGGLPIGLLLAVALSLSPPGFFGLSFAWPALWPLPPSPLPLELPACCPLPWSPGFLASAAALGSGGLFLAALSELEADGLLFESPCLGALFPAARAASVALQCLHSP